MNNPNLPLRSSGVPVAAIIPAHNEARHILNVLEVLHKDDSLSEIIVVDDGSTDDTPAKASQIAQIDPRVRVLRHDVNKGKGQAMTTGWHATQAPILLFLDADLIRLNVNHVQSLIQPVLEDRVDMSVGLFRGGRLLTDLAHLVTPWLSGQRCLKADLLKSVSREAAAGYGIETAITIAAKNGRWRCCKVPLQGVTHPHSEFRRGIWVGIGTRARMYGEILRAWWIVGRKKGQKYPGSYVLRLLILILLVLLGGSRVYDRSRAKFHLGLNDLSFVSLEGIQRVLVIAPHPDDETLGAGGLIQEVIAQGKEVKVVVVTNGDGQVLAPMALLGRIRLSPRDYIAIGELRQSETLAALEQLGVSPESVIFLGYADRSLNALWMGNWRTECPVRSTLTRATRSEYGMTYHLYDRYCGIDVLGDLLYIIASYKPDLVVLPHINDEHPDHRATSNFARLALDLQHVENPEYTPHILGYLIHYGYFPQPRGSRLEDALLPPFPLVEKQYQWSRLDLTPQEEEVKLIALKKYTTQMRLLGNFLSSFARKDEIFITLPMLSLNSIDFPSIPPLDIDSAGEQNLETLMEPGKESARRVLAGGADLVGWRIARLGDELYITACTRARLLPGLHYRILIKSPSGDTYSLDKANPGVSLGKNSFTAQINLAQIGHPSVLGFAAEVQKAVVLDRTGWQFLILQSWTP